MSWRAWLAFVGIGSALALAWRGDWLAAGEAAAAVLLPVSAWALGQFRATRTTLRGLAEMSELAEAQSFSPRTAGKPGVHSVDFCAVHSVEKVHSADSLATL